MSMSAGRADAVLPSSGWVWLHTGTPGAAGTGNVAEFDSSAIDRKSVTFGSAENHPDNTERRVLSSTDVDWSGTEIDAAQELTHFSVWSAETDGNVLHIAALAEPKTTGSDGASIPTGDLEVAIGVFAKP